MRLNVRVMISAAILLAAASAHTVYQIARQNITCWSDRYGGANYLAACANGHFVEYETGAIFYALEPEIAKAVGNADVVVLGSSKAQAAFSSRATLDYFNEKHVHFYLLGFGYDNLAGFALPMLKQRKIKPKLMIVNADPYFIPAIPQSGAGVVGGTWETYSRLASGIVLQKLQRVACLQLPHICQPHERTIYRSRATGQWLWQDSYYPEQAVPLNEMLHSELSQDEFKSAVAFGRTFINELAVDRSCIVFTGIPNNTRDAPSIALQLAQHLGVQYIAPEIENLSLLDDSHLNFASAERWSAAFLAMVTPILERCLDLSDSRDRRTFP